MRAILEAESLSIVALSGSKYPIDVLRWLASVREVLRGAERREEF
jgi:hypothetical protein